MISYNDGYVYDLIEPTLNPDKEKMAKNFSEGNIYLERLLLSCWNNNITTFACCAGEKERDICSYLALIVNEYSVNFINRIIDAMSSYDSDSVDCYFSNTPVERPLSFILDIYDKSIIDNVYSKINDLVNSDKMVNDKYLYQAKIVDDYFKLERNLKFAFHFSVNNYIWLFYQKYSVTNSIKSSVSEINNTGRIQIPGHYKCDEHEMDELCANLIYYSLMRETNYSQEFMKLPLEFKKFYITKFYGYISDDLINMYENNIPIVIADYGDHGEINVSVNKDDMDFIERAIYYTLTCPKDILVKSLELSNLEDNNTIMKIEFFGSDFIHGLSKLTDEVDIPFNPFSSRLIEFDLYALIRNLKYKLIKYGDNMYLEIGDNLSKSEFDSVLNYLETTGDLMMGRYNCDINHIEHLTNILKEQSIKLIPYDETKLGLTEGYHK